jgi:hypothetical protein
MAIHGWAYEWRGQDKGIGSARRLSGVAVIVGGIGVSRKIVVGFIDIRRFGFV